MTESLRGGPHGHRLFAFLPKKLINTQEVFTVARYTNQPEGDRIAFIGNYLPRQCGIATFTTDLCEAIATEFPDRTCIAVPVNDVESGYAYPPRVRFELIEKDINS